MMPGTKMTFAGLKKPGERADVVAYIVSIAAPKRRRLRPEPGAERAAPPRRCAFVHAAGRPRRPLTAGAGDFRACFRRLLKTGHTLVAGLPGCVDKRNPAANYKRSIWRQTGPEGTVADATLRLLCCQTCGQMHLGG